MLSGDQVEPRVVEALPAVLAWNDWNVRLLEGYARTYDRRVRYRAAWLADVAQTIHTHHGFPGGCVNPRTLSALWRRAKRPSEPDSLGYPADQESLPPVSRRWNITYAADLDSFRRRAEHLHSLRTPPPRPGVPPSIVPPGVPPSIVPPASAPGEHLHTLRTPPRDQTESST
ncbi:MAG TPA: hypothetical protein VKA46_26965 [Gemmataceae bacterium]|nr:hypothetical protein [Gemmataceae bacterium]